MAFINAQNVSNAESEVQGGRYL